MPKHWPQLVMFDLAGTTVDDHIGGEPLMILAMRRAFAAEGVELQLAQIVPHRGKEKREAIEALCKEHMAFRTPSFSDTVDRIFASFTTELEQYATQVKALDGAPSSLYLSAVLESAPENRELMGCLHTHRR